MTFGGPAEIPEHLRSGWSPRVSNGPVQQRTRLQQCLDALLLDARGDFEAARQAIRTELTLRGPQFCLEWSEVEEGYHLRVIERVFGESGSLGVFGGRSQRWSGRIEKKAGPAKISVPETTSAAPARLRPLEKADACSQHLPPWLLDPVLASDMLGDRRELLDRRLALGASEFHLACSFAWSVVIAVYLTLLAHALRALRPRPTK